MRPAYSTQLSFLGGSKAVDMTGAWTRDGKWVVAPAEIGGSLGLYVFSTNGGGRMPPLSVEAGPDPWYGGSLGALPIFADGLESGDTSAC